MKASILANPEPAAANGQTLTFFRQSGWLVIATVFCGVFMTLVHPLTKNMANNGYALFGTLLRVFVILSIPGGGLQTVLAQQAAATLNPEGQLRLKGIIRAALTGVLSVWLLAAAVIAVFQSSITAHLKTTEPLALWITILAALPALWLPILQGTLQGRQNFSWLGFSMIFNGLARFGCVILFVLMLHGGAISAMTAALFGVTGALVIAAWPIRSLLAGSPKLIWRPWLQTALPLTFGSGSILFVMSADVPFVNSHFDGEFVKLYLAASTLGVALVMFTTPMAMVMFPKLVRSNVTAQQSSALSNALGGTALLGFVGALVCSFFPELPLQIMYHGNIEFLQSAPLVRWIMWAMLPVTLANVLINNLLAREQWKVVPWLVATAVGYGITLTLFLKNPISTPFDAFRTIIQILGIFSLILLAVATFFTWRMRSKNVV